MVDDVNLGGAVVGRGVDATDAGRLVSDEADERDARAHCDAIPVGESGVDLLVLDDAVAVPVGAHARLSTSGMTHCAIRGVVGSC